MLADYHVHTSFSNDSTYEMEDVIRQAIALGLDEICFTEHVDYGVDYEICDYDAYNKRFLECRDKYEAVITLKKGIEFGVQLHTAEQFKRAFAANNFDFVIMSCHEIDNQEFWNQNFQRGRTQAEYNRLYYEALLTLTEVYKDYSVLGHLDLIRRYDKAGDYPFSKVRTVVEQLLRQVISDGKGLEINTSNVRYGINDFTPSREIIELYRDLGGRILSIGSDSHKKEHLGFNLAVMQQELKLLGFTEFCTFAGMEPVFHKL